MRVAFGWDAVYALGLHTSTCGSKRSPCRPHGKLYVAQMSSTFWLGIDLVVMSVGSRIGLRLRSATIAACGLPNQTLSVPHTMRRGPMCQISLPSRNASLRG